MKKLLPLFFCLVTCFTQQLQAQSISEIIATLDIDTLIGEGHSDNRINWAFANIDHASSSKKDREATYRLI